MRLRCRSSGAIEPLMCLVGGRIDSSSGDVTATPLSNKTPMESRFEKAARVIDNAEAIFISAGAGMGVDSGLPDFRGDHGFWRAYPALKNENISFQELANPWWFTADVARAWGFYGHRFNLYRKTDPHQGFGILQSWARSKTIAPFVFTSNVDGHFQKSGFSAEALYECHGSINHLQCTAGCADDIWPLHSLNLEIDESSLTASGSFPTCPNCGQIARPNILMFGDPFWLPDRSHLQKARYDAWKKRNSSARIVTVELGAGKTIPTVRIASESMWGSMIRINPRDSEGHGAISIPRGALEALSRIDDVLTGRKRQRTCSSGE